jgi:hypothetical protein
LPANIRLGFKALPGTLDYYQQLQITAVKSLINLGPVEFTTDKEMLSSEVDGAAPLSYTPFVMLPPGDNFIKLFSPYFTSLAA